MGTLIFKNLANAILGLFAWFATYVFFPVFAIFPKYINGVRRKNLNFFRISRDEYVAAVNRLLRQLDGESPVFTRSNLETIAGSEASCLFLLSCGGEIVGMASLCVYASPIGRKAWIEDVVVDSRFRGRSFGKFLVMHILERTRKLGRLTVMLTSRPSRIAANALYRSVGFETKETNVYIKKI